jgi:sulfite exporter TauE/SafE
MDSNTSKKNQSSFKMEYWTAFTLGLFGSLHCIGMCGPIALALPYQDRTKLGTLGNMLLYNGGRSISYTVIGIIPGLLGLGVFISGYQTSLSILLGVGFLIVALFSINLDREILRLPGYQRFNKWLRAQFQRQLNRRTKTTFLSIGLLNGFLPCGMVYLAVAAAITQTSILGAMGYMFAFGLGTLPLMLVASLSGNAVSLRFRKQLFRLTPILTFLFGLFFLLRGFQVELPGDMNFWLVEGAQKMCH